MHITKENLEILLDRFGAEAMLYCAANLMDNKRPAMALPLLHFLAEHQPPLPPEATGDAQELLALCYENGLGTKKDQEKAFRWIRAAADNGSPMAQLEVARYHDPENHICHTSLPKSRDKAMYWYKKAAEGGSVKAMLCLSDVYMGEGDFGQAQLWLEKAAARSSPTAVEFLSLALYGGEDGFQRDPQKAAAYMRRGMEMGLPQSYMLYAGYLLESGEEEEMERVVARLAEMVELPIAEVSAAARGDKFSARLKKRMMRMQDEILQKGLE